MHILPISKDIRCLQWICNARVGSKCFHHHRQSPSCDPDQYWLLNGELSSGRWQERSPADVPKGFLPVYVGPESRRFVIPMNYLSMPDFRILMEKVEEEFGFDQEAGLKIPCKEEDFEEVLLKCLARQKQLVKAKRRN
ncbi:hypothetical protein Ancab_029227 [Ancistrocladus abbreviatus]